MASFTLTSAVQRIGKESYARFGDDYASAFSAFLNSDEFHDSCRKLGKYDTIYFFSLGFGMARSDELESE